MADKKEEKLVTVEMTEAQKQKVVALLADDKEKNAPVQMAEVFLSFEHNRNNVKYIGNVKVPADLAASLLAADQAHLRMRLKENESYDHLHEIVGRGVARVIK